MLRQQLREVYTSETGASFRNPVDLYWGRGDLIQQALKIIARCEQIDLLVLYIILGLFPSGETELVNPFIESIIAQGEEISQRTAVVLHAIGGLSKSERLASESRMALYKAGFAVFPSADRAADTISKFIQYHHRR